MHGPPKALYFRPVRLSIGAGEAFFGRRTVDFSSFDSNDSLFLLFHWLFSFEN